MAILAPAESLPSPATLVLGGNNTLYTVFHYSMYSVVAECSVHYVHYIVYSVGQLFFSMGATTLWPRLQSWKPFVRPKSNASAS